MNRTSFFPTPSGNAAQIGAPASIPEALDRLIALYTATKNSDEAKKYRDLRAKYPSPKETLPPPRADK